VTPLSLAAGGNVSIEPAVRTRGGRHSGSDGRLQSPQPRPHLHLGPPIALALEVEPAPRDLRDVRHSVAEADFVEGAVGLCRRGQQRAVRLARGDGGALPRLRRKSRRASRERES
jgi:hypothetical protein